MSEKNSLFFSYGHDNNSKIVLDYLKPALEKEGFKIWVDKSEIKTGDDWRDSIVNGIENSHGVVAYLSKYSVRDPGVCRDELRIARSISGCKIVTVMLESPYEVQPPLTVSHIQYLDMSDWQNKLEKGEKIFKEWFDYKFNELKEAIEKNSDLPGIITEVRQKIKPALDSNSYVGDLENLLSEKIVSRDWIVRKVEDWQNSSDRKQVFCLTGEPGFGKSVVSAIVATECKLNAIGVHFCKLNSGFNDAKTIFTQLCFQLATKIPSYARALISDEYNWDIANANDVFEKAFVEIPKKCIDGNREKSFLLIDALDEAPEELVEILAHNYKKLPKWLGFFVTSRPNEARIKHLLDEFTAEYIDSSDCNNLNDVKNFINEQLVSFGLDNELKESFSNKLLSTANGNFRYASVFLDSLDKEHCIEIITNFVKGKSVFPKNLSELYSSTFKQTFNDLDYYEKEILPILGLLTVSRYPVPLDFITSTLDTSEKDLIKKLKSLNSMVRLSANNDSISLFHRSVQEWLVDKNNDYSVDKKDSEKKLLLSLVKFLDYLLDLLKEDSLDEDSSELLDKDSNENEEKVDDIDDILGFSDDELSVLDEKDSKENLSEQSSILSQISFFINSFPDLLKNIFFVAGKFDKDKFIKFIKEEQIQKLCSNLDELKEYSKIFDTDSEFYSNETQKGFLVFVKYINKLSIDLFGKEGKEDQQASHCLANVLLDLNDSTNAEKLYSRVIKLEEKNHILDSENILYLNKDYAISLSENYKYKDAVIQFEELLKEENLSKNLDLYFTVLLNYADCLEELGQSTKALTVYDECVKLVAENESKLSLEAKLAALNNRGTIYLEQGENEKRIKDCEYIVEQAIEGNLSKSDIAFYKLNLANSYIEDEQFDKALGLIIESQSIYEKIYGKDSKEYLSIQEAFCNYYDSTGDIKETLRIRRELVENYKKYYGNNSGQVIEAKLELIFSLEQMDEYSEISQIISELNNIIEEKYGINHPFSWEILNRISNFYVSEGDYDKAISIANKVRDSLKLNDVDLRYLQQQDLLASIYALSGRDDIALKIYDDCLANKEKLLGNNSESYLNTLTNIAGTYRSLGEKQKAEKLYKTIINSCKENFGEDSRDYYQAVIDYANFLGDDNFGKGVKLFRDVLNNIKERNSFYYEVQEQLADLLGTSFSHKNIAESIKIYREIIKFRENRYGPVSSSLIEPITQLSDLLSISNKSKDALKLLQSKIALFENKFSSQHKFIFELKQTLIDVYIESEKYASAVNLCRDLTKSCCDYYGEFHKETIQIKEKLYRLEDDYVNNGNKLKSVEQMMKLYSDTLSHYGNDNSLTITVGDSLVDLNLKHKCNLDWIGTYCNQRLKKEEGAFDKVKLMQSLAELSTLKKEFSKSYDLYKKAFSLYKKECAEFDETRIYELDFEVKKLEFLLSPNEKSFQKVLNAALYQEILNEDPLISVSLLQELSQCLKDNNFAKESKKVDKKIKELDSEYEPDEEKKDETNLTENDSADSDIYEFVSSIFDYLSECCLSEKDFKPVLEEIKDYLKETKEIPDIDKDFYYLHIKYAYARTLWGLNKFKDAIKTLEELIHQIRALEDEDNTINHLCLSCYLVLGKIHFYQSKPEQAIDWLTNWLDYEKSLSFKEDRERIEVYLYITEANMMIQGAVKQDDILSLENLKKECQILIKDGDKYVKEYLSVLNNDVIQFNKLLNNDQLKKKGKNPIYSVISESHEFLKYSFKNWLPSKKKSWLSKLVSWI